MKKNKILTVCSLLAVSVVLLTACGKKNNGNTGENTESTMPQTSSQAGNNTGNTLAESTEPAQESSLMYLRDAVAEALGGQPPGRDLFPGAAQPSAQHREELAAAAEVVAEEFIAAEEREDQRQEQVDQAKPGKEDVEKAQDKEDDGQDPEIVIPVLFLHATPSLSRMEMQTAGQVRSQRPQPIHRSVLTSA